MKYAKWAEKLMAPHGIKRSSGIHEVKFSLIGEPTFIQMMIVKCGYVVQLDTESRRKYGIRKCGIRKCGTRKLMN